MSVSVYMHRKMAKGAERDGGITPELPGLQGKIDTLYKRLQIPVRDRVLSGCRELFRVETA